MTGTGTGATVGDGAGVGAIGEGGWMLGVVIVIGGSCLLVGSAMQKSVLLISFSPFKQPGTVAPGPRWKQMRSSSQSESASQSPSHCCNGKALEGGVPPKLTSFLGPSVRALVGAVGACGAMVGLA